MKIQNENLDQQNIDGVHDKVSEGRRSAEEWLRLERLVGSTPDAVLPSKPRLNRDKKHFVGGMLATVVVLATYQVSMNFYNTDMPSLMVSPAVTSAKAAFTQMTVRAQKSIITGIVDPDTLTASLYWTIDLKNTSGVDQEAQAELKLPPGAVVSRATLWVNGVPQEAAFNTTQQVTNAYQWITVKHRDPLLVTYKDDHTVLIKAAPVPANGDIMKIRLGITAPLTLGAEGKTSLAVPEIKEANFTLADSNDIHLESKRQIGFFNGQSSTLQRLFGKYLLTANMPASELSKLTIVSNGHSKAESFAVRATHSLPGTFIVAGLDGDSDDEVAHLKRSSDLPKCRIVKSEQAAHRVSTLWASGEVSRLLEEGKRTEAEDLAAVFRIVSPVSGAVVLETDYDYNAMALHRDQYMVSVPGQRPKASKNGQQAGNGMRGVQPVLQGSTGAPILQGATNGTISPQGADSTVVQGVNTAGTVTVNNLAQLDALAAILTCALQIGLFIASLFFALRGLRKSFLTGFRAGIKDWMTAGFLLFSAALWYIALPLLAAVKVVELVVKKFRGGRVLQDQSCASRPTAS
jgi:hypothetical protein